LLAASGGSGLARDDIGVVTPANRSAGIAGKPAPTDFVVFIKSAAGVGQCGSGLARDGIDVVFPANRRAGIAGKPACVFKVS